MPVTLKKLSSIFKPFAPPTELVSLLEFEKNVPGEWYAEGFEFGEADKSLIESFSEDSEFTAGLIPIGLANGSGSAYFLWTAGQTDTTKMPVVIFGDEGGFHVVAENVRNLLTILAFDAEPMVDWDEVSYYRETDSDEHSSKHEDYVAWLKQTLDIEPAADVTRLIEKAQARYKTDFGNWVGRFYKQ